MNFIYPGFLWALFLVAIPIIIHFVNLRKHKAVYFSNVNLLKRVKKETRKRSKLKQILILIARTAMLTFLVLAFAKPYIPGDDQQKQEANNIVGLYIDNSFSMNAESKEGKAIESAKQKALTIVSSSRADTKFALLTNNFSMRQLRFYSRNEIMNLIADVDVSHQWSPMSNVLLRFNGMIDDFLFDSKKSIYFISDFQKYTSDINNFEFEESFGFNFVPVSVNKISNLYIDTCWFDAPMHHLNQQEVLYARVVNNSDENYYQTTVNFYMNDSLKSLATVDLEAGRSEIIELKYTNLNAGLQFGRIEISDFPIVYDNKLFLAYKVKENLKALVIQNNNNAVSRKLRALFSNDEYINLDLVELSRIQISSFNNYSTIILNELPTLSSGLQDELVRYINNGGTVVNIPPLTKEYKTYNGFFESINAPTYDLVKKIRAQSANADSVYYELALDTIEIPLAEINYSHPIYKDVFKDNKQDVTLPNTHARYRIKSGPGSNSSELLSFADQSTAISYSSYGKGTFYSFSMPLSIEKNEFTRHLLFVPTFYNIVLQSSFTQRPYYTTGKDQDFDVLFSRQSANSNFLLTHLQSGKQLVPQISTQRGNRTRLTANEALEAGFYTVQNNQETVAGIAFNYNLKESEFSYFDVDELRFLAEEAGIATVNVIDAKTENLSTTIDEIDSGKQLWKRFIMLAIFFLLFEAAIIRFMK